MPKFNDPVESTAREIDEDWDTLPQERKDAVWLEAFDLLEENDKGSLTIAHASKALAMTFEKQMHEIGNQENAAAILAILKGKARAYNTDA